MSKSNHVRNIILSLAIIALVMVVIVYIYLYQSTWGLVDETIKAKNIVSAAQVMRLQEKEIMNLYENTKEDRAKVNGLFVPAANAVAFIKAVEAVGAESGAVVTISSIRSTAPDPDTKLPVGEVTANVSVTGSWGQTMRALELFENQSFLNTISHVSLRATSESDKAKQTTWSLSFDIKAYSI